MKIGPMYGHIGTIPGYQTFTGYDPDKKNTLLVWANLSATSDVRLPANIIAEEAVHTLYS